MTPDTIGPLIMARPCPANPNETSFTPKYSVGMIVFFSGSCFDYINNTRVIGLVHHKMKSLENI